MSIHYDSIPVNTPEQLNAFHDLLRVTGERIDGDPNHLRSHAAVLDLAGVFLDWVDVTEVNLGVTLGLETGPDHRIQRSDNIAPVAGTGERPRMVQRIPKDRRVHSHEHHGGDHDHHDKKSLLSRFRNRENTILPRYRPMEKFTGTEFEGTMPEDTQRFWQISNLRIGQGQAVRNHRWYIGQTLKDPLNGTKMYDNNGGKIGIMPNGGTIENGRVVEEPRNINKLGLLKPAPTEKLLLPNTATTLHVLGRAAQFAVDNNVNPTTFS